MADWDLLPNQVPNGTFGYIVYEGPPNNRRFPISNLDYLYLCAMGGSESRAAIFTAWSLIQNFGGGGMGNRETLKRGLELYSAPINPTYDFEGAPSPARVGRYPSGRNINSIPGPVNRRIWDLVMRTSGSARPFTLRPGGMAGRRGRIRKIRRAWEGDMSAWQGVAGGSRGLANSRTREVMFKILTGRMGNPIPGFDDFAALRRGTSRTVPGGIYDDLGWGKRVNQRRYQFVNVHGLVGAEREARFQEIYAARGRQIVRFGPDQSTNVFGYRRTGGIRRGGRVWIEGPSGADSRTAPIEAPFAGAAGVDVTISLGGGAAHGTITDGGDGAASGGNYSSSSSSTSSTRVLTIFDRSQLPSQEEVENRVAEWAGSMESHLTSSVGARRNY